MPPVVLEKLLEEANDRQRPVGTVKQLILDKRAGVFLNGPMEHIHKLDTWHESGGDLQQRANKLPNKQRGIQPFAELLCYAISQFSLIK